ncbi:Reverse transcriptase (RNA-dependent DNA polymerase) [Popillia japonica]|uniref:Reverse transcriptase (RNA-dependent DNA polymerase) n=1 Tax=Popillia japonica TaxID=7064 RepID=A0AAW1HRP7_POPJA
MGSEAFDLLTDLCNPEKPENCAFEDLVDLMGNHLQPKPSDIADRKSGNREAYTEFMAEYERLGHMSIEENDEKNEPSFYLPHHGVSSQNSQTTRLRVVFDGSAPSTTGWSLNDLQYVGQNLQDELLNLILRFRQWKYVICADIMKMYRQILIRPEQRSLQKILWRKNPSENISVYTLNTVTYGTTSAPYLAIRCLKQLATENQEKHPEAARIISDDFYVDDMLTGGDKAENVIKRIEEVKTILQSAGFELHKWLSNSPPILEQLLPKNQSPQTISFDKHAKKTVGIDWTCADDTFRFTINVQTERPITKRTKIRIPRYIFNSLPVHIELHGFSDASERAYGACVYIRINLLCAKTKVAPIRSITIPRLELCGTLILSQLANKVKISSQLTFDKCYLWSDSTIALHWINTSPNVLQPFVSNRVSQIQSLTSSNEWHHIRSEDNPADILSRGTTPTDLLKSTMWWHGPSWLHEPEENWPMSILTVPKFCKPRHIPYALKAKVEVFERLDHYGLKLQLSKCTLCQNKVEYLGFIIDERGVHTAPDKINAIVNCKVPNNITELRAFLGLVNYYSKFIPNVATKLNPLYSLLHLSHLGVNKCKAIARSYFWWPNLDLDVEKMCSNCKICTTFRNNPPKITFNPWPLAIRPWSRLHLDFLGPIFNRKYLIIVDTYTKWIEVFELSSTNAINTINKL